MKFIKLLTDDKKYFCVIKKSFTQKHKCMTLHLHIRIHNFPLMLLQKFDAPLQQFNQAQIQVRPETRDAWGVRRSRVSEPPLS